VVPRGPAEPAVTQPTAEGLGPRIGTSPDGLLHAMIAVPSPLNGTNVSRTRGDR
jgi:hypothetical protein